MIPGAIAGLLVALIFGAISAAAASKRKKARAYTEDNGEPTIGWLVQANNALFKAGTTDLPALVLISPDAETSDDEEYMTGLADDIMELKGADCDDDDEAFVSELVTKEAYVEGKRTKLPKSFARRPNVYLAHIYIYREHLPKGKLTGREVKCVVVWDEPGTMICTHPAKARKGRRDRREYDEEDDD